MGYITSQDGSHKTGFHDVATTVTRSDPANSYDGDSGTDSIKFRSIDSPNDT